MKKAIKVLLLTVTSLLILGIALFYVLIVFGLSPKLQSTWVCTAMTTMNHQYLATMFFSDEKIEKILKENAVDDTGLESELKEFETPEFNDKFENPTLALTMLKKGQKKTPSNQYIAEGYRQLESGIYIKEIKDTTIRAFVVLVKDPLRVKLVDTSYQFEKGQTVKRMVTDSNAILGINGGGFQDGANYDSNGGMPAGLLIENSKLISPIDVNDEKEYSMIGINKNGVLVLKKTTALWAMENDIVSAVSFSPYLVVNGEGTIKNGTGGWGIAPRTAIGQRKSGEILFLIVDGRQIGWSIGCDLDVLQKIMLEEKAENAAMLDGGSSTVLFYNGEYLNRPSLGHERLINNAFVVEKLK